MTRRKLGGAFWLVRHVKSQYLHQSCCVASSEKQQESLKPAFSQAFPAAHHTVSWVVRWVWNGNLEGQLVTLGVGRVIPLKSQPQGY